MKARIWFRFFGIPGSIKVELDVPSMDMEDLQKTLEKQVDTEMDQGVLRRLPNSRPQIFFVEQLAC
jgi:hypothetical protein